MPHANWKGVISFGLVNIPIQLFNSENKASNISFRQIDKRDGSPIKYKRININTEKEVPWEDIGKGFEYDKDNILEVKEGELKKVVGENAKTIAIESFVDKKNLNLIDIIRTYYLVPDKKGEKGYAILREALKNSNKIGIAKVIISTKEYLAAVATFEDAIVLYTLHYPNEIRKLSEFNIPSEDLKKYKITHKEIEIAKQLINSMTVKWKPEKYKDEYKEVVHKWVEQKVHHLPETKMKQRSQGKTTNVVNFVDLLKRSMETMPKKKSVAKKSKSIKLTHRPKSQVTRHATKH